MKATTTTGELSRPPSCSRKRQRRHHAVAASGGRFVAPTWLLLIAVLTTTRPDAAAVVTAFARTASLKQHHSLNHGHTILFKSHWRSTGETCPKRRSLHLLSATSKNKSPVDTTTSDDASPTTSQEDQDADRQRGLVVLLTVPFAWGTFEPAVRYVYAMDPPLNSNVFSLAYYAVAASALLTAAALTAGSRRRAAATFDSSTTTVDWPWAGGFELGTYLFVGNALQIFGLKTVPADRAAFLLQLTTIFVPLLSAALNRSWTTISVRTWLACGVALAGVGVMGLDGSEATTTTAAAVTTGGVDSSTAIQNVLSNFGTGDALIVAAAVSYTFHCLRLEGYAKQTSAVQLAASKATTETAWSALAMLGLVWYSQGGDEHIAATNGASDDGSFGSFLQTSGQDITSFVSTFDQTYGSMPMSVWLPAALAVLWTGLVTVAYTIYAQSYGQRRVQPVTANLIYTVQPLCTAVLAWILLGERLGTAGYVGGLLIGSAVLLVVAPQDEKQESSEQ